MNANVAPGVDLMNLNVLKKLTAMREDGEDKLFLTGYTKFVHCMLNGTMPKSSNAYFSSNLLIALTKSKTDIRPIGIGTLLRKIASKLVEKSARQFNNTHFQKSAFSLKKSAWMQKMLSTASINTLDYRKF